MTSYLSILACCLLWEWSCCLGCSAGCWAESVFLLLTPGLGQVTWKYKELLFICLNRDYLYNLSKARVRGVEPFWDYIIWNLNCSTYLCRSSLEECLFSWHPLHLLPIQQKLPILIVSLINWGDSPFRLLYLKHTNYTKVTVWILGSAFFGSMIKHNI